MELSKLRDFDNTIIEFILAGLKSFDQLEDNSMDVLDREKMYELMDLLFLYRDGYNCYYRDFKKEIAKELADKSYDRMFELLKVLLPKLII